MKNAGHSKALLLCASHNDLGLIRAIKKLGYYIIAAGTKADCMGVRWVDRWISEDYSDKERILAIAKEENVDVICQCCNDFGVYTAAYVAEQMELPGYDSYETTLTLHNKDKFKHFAKENDILTPETQCFDNEKDAMKAICGMDMPLIVKPVDASAGNGISKIENTDDVQKAVKGAFDKSRDGRIVVEPFLVGKQYGFCTFLLNRKVVAVASNNEYSFENPYRVEIDTFPADNYKECCEFLVEEIEKMAQILHLKDGIFHLQYIYYNGRPYIIEVMRRILGNMYHVPGNMLTGIDWEYWETRAKCGLDCAEFPVSSMQEGYYAYKAVMANENGVIDKINVPDEYRKYIYNEYWLLREGDIVTTHLKEPVGFLFMMFSSRKEMEDVLISKYRNDFVSMKERVYE